MRTSPPFSWWRRVSRGNPGSGATIRRCACSRSHRRDWRCPPGTRIRIRGSEPCLPDDRIHCSASVVAALQPSSGLLEPRAPTGGGLARTFCGCLQGLADAQPLCTCQPRMIRPRAFGRVVAARLAVARWVSGVDLTKDVSEPAREALELRLTRRTRLRHNRRTLRLARMPIVGPPRANTSGAARSGSGVGPSIGRRAAIAVGTCPR
jgi:hypothetical protein